MKIRILSSALEDLAKGRQFYDRQGEGLGDYFIDTLFSDIDSLVLYAGIHRRIGNYYRLLSKRFPFAIYYQVHDKVVQVWRAGLQARPGKNQKGRQIENHNTVAPTRLSLPPF